MMLGALLIARREAAQGAVLHTWIDDRLLPPFEARILAVDTARSVARGFPCRISAPNAMP